MSNWEKFYDFVNRVNKYHCDSDAKFKYVFAFLVQIFDDKAPLIVSHMISNLIEEKNEKYKKSNRSLEVSLGILEEKLSGGFNFSSKNIFANLILASKGYFGNEELHKNESDSIKRFYKRLSDLAKENIEHFKNGDDFTSWVKNRQISKLLENLLVFEEK